MKQEIGVWFPTVRADTGVDVFTEQLVTELNKLGIRAQIEWLPHYAEFFPWAIKIPKPPSWATVVHVNSWLPNRLIPKNLPRVVTFHSCVHDLNLLPYKSLTQKIYHQMWVRRCESENIANADRITSVSNYTAARLKETFSIENVETIHNWVDSSFFSPSEKRAELSYFKILFVGSLSQRKGVDLLAPIMRKLGPNYRLYFTGLAHEIQLSSRLPDNMISLGRIENPIDLVSLYRESDLLLLPSRMEGLPLVALEAMACGTPVIGTNCASLPEVIEHGKTGFLCEIDNVEEFVSNITLMRDQPSTCNQIGKNSRANVVEHFSMPVAVRKYRLIYENIQMFASLNKLSK